MPPEPTVADLVAELVAAVRDAGGRPLPLLLGVGDAAAFLGVSRAAFYRLIAAGELPAALDVPGCGPRWRRADLERWAAKLRPRRGRPAERIVDEVG